MPDNRLWLGNIPPNYQQRMGRMENIVEACDKLGPYEQHLVLVSEGNLLLIGLPV